MIALRRAGPADRATLLPLTRALNEHEAIAVSDGQLAAGLDVLLADPSIGGAWLIERAGDVIGYALVTFGFDLEFGGRDAVLTELWVDPAARSQGVGAAALDALAPAVRALGVRALHLQVRPDNPARALYARSGFVASPRIVMTKRLVDDAT